MKEDLLKRQEELKKEFEEMAKYRDNLIGQTRESEVRLNQLSGAYNEITRQLKELEPKEADEKQT
jgi:uncharacterized coiled-coil DUF342 family protein